MSKQRSGARGAWRWCVGVVLWAAVAVAQSGTVKTTPAVPMELPIEVEIELSPAGSLKNVALWKELYQLLRHPYGPDDVPGTPDDGTVTRRPGFGVAMPPLGVYPLDYNFLTGQPLRLRTSDGELSWDQPGPMFDPAEVVTTDAFNSPTQLRKVVGHLVACPDDPPYQAATLPPGFCKYKPKGSLVVFNSTNCNRIPPTGTVVAVAAVKDGVLQELAYESSTKTEDVEELEIPVNEEDFFRDPKDTTYIPYPLKHLLGRPAAEVLGKALFWDMQVGSDGVQACASCHFHAGVDNRTRGQINPGTLAGDHAINIASVAGSVTTNVEVQPSDFPFHKGAQDSLAHDANDVFSSMGVSRFKRFIDIPRIGSPSFLPASMGIRALAPDIGLEEPDPVPVMQGVRRVEERHTPTFHGAAFNFDNFWDGRARFSFNGGSSAGPMDPTAHIFINPKARPYGAHDFTGATMGHLRPELLNPAEDDYDPELARQPVRIKFASLASQALDPPISNFEMSFDGRNWPKLGKKLLQGDEGYIETLGKGAPQQRWTNRSRAVVPLANQRVAVDDSRLGPFSNQGGSLCVALGRPTQSGKPGLCISYPDLIRLAFDRRFWNRADRHLIGKRVPCDPNNPAHNGLLTPRYCDPFDGFVLKVGYGPADRYDTNRFTQMEANFSLFFALSVQAYESLTIPDHSPADQFFELNPNAGHAVGEAGDQAVLYPTLVPDLLDDGQLNGTHAGGVVLLADDPSTPFFDGFGPDEVFGFDIFAGANLTAGLRPADAVDPRSGIDRNPEVSNSLGQKIRVGSNPFTRSAKCMLCHLGPEQTDHSINIAHGVLKNDAEFEYPTLPRVADPTTPPTFPDGTLPAPEPSGRSMTVPGLILSEEVSEGAAQDAVEVEPRDFAVFDDPDTPWDDRVVAQQSNFAFGDQGVYNIGLRPTLEDLGRGGVDRFGWPLSLAALTLKNVGGRHYEPCDTSLSSCVMANFDPSNLDAAFERTGGGVPYPGTWHDLQSVNPGYERDPINPRLPAYMRPWMHGFPAGELHPQIDELAGMVPNTLTPPNGGPAIEFAEILFGADFHCARYDPAIFGNGPPNFGWGPPSSNDRLCPQNQSGAAGNLLYPTQGTWPVPNRVMRAGAFKAPPLRNVELTGPYFHTGSYLTLRQVVDFYERGGDFPLTNRESRDPHMVNLLFQAFAFGPSQGGTLTTPFDCSTDAPNDAAYPLVPGSAADRCSIFSYLIGSFGDGLPDTVFRYDAMPDTDHPLTPEYATVEDAKNALVKFMLALTDPRVKLEKAPFDHPELFVPIDAAAPDNTGGPGQLSSQVGVPCPTMGPNPGPVCFRRIGPIGQGGRPACSATVTTDCGPLTNFLGVSSEPLPGANNDHFDPNPP